MLSICVCDLTETLDTVDFPLYERVSMIPRRSGGSDELTVVQAGVRVHNAEVLLRHHVRHRLHLQQRASYPSGVALMRGKRA